MRAQGAAACIALAALAACRPTAEGRCAQDSDCRTDAFCSPEGICLAVSPSLTVTVTTPADGAGWYLRSGPALSVLAQITRDGTDPVSASLTVPGCASATCTFPGTPVEGGFSFQVPRDVQFLGSAAPRPFQVTVDDRAGNQGEADGVLQIDDAPPAIGAIVPVSAGTAGEDGKTWFAGGAGKPDVEISVQATDPGAGVASVAVHLDPADVLPGTPLDPAPIAGPGGTVHFQVPVSGMRGEGPMRFSVVATDQLGNASSVPVASIQVDAVAPAVTAPHVDYAGAQPAGVCDATATCGRQSATHLLRDDVALLTLDVTDCGAGTGLAAVAVSGGKTISAVETGVSPSTCANGNQTHHFQATVDFGDAAPSLPQADGFGTVLLPVTGSGADRMGNAATGAAPSGATGGDGLAVISLWRWKQQLPGPPTGAPVLLASSGKVAVGTATAVTALTTAGAKAWTQAVARGVGADLALGPSGKIYAVSPVASCASSCTGYLTIVTSTGTPTVCTQNNTTLGAPPAVTTANVSGNPVEVAVVVATARRNLGTNNLFVYPGTCSSTDNLFLINGNSELTGVSALPGKVVLASAATFTSIDQNGTNFNFGAAATYNGSVALLDAPALVPNAPLNAIFGTFSGDLHRVATTSTCTGSTCWKDMYTAPWPHTPGALSRAPVFDGTHVYTSDDAGNVYSWVQSSGAPAWTQALGGAISGPAILQDPSGMVLVVQQSGALKLVGAAGAATLLSVAGYSGAPPVPALDASGSYGRAYVPDGAGLVWAIDLPSPPLQASAVAWPRPGRDSCNSRSAGAPCP
ncbi:MAG TPA: PQQ-binding-like beta-propeller repeat protein [Myxococcales bacterium]|nr:PQQ-binding-like beta-propeller repeat protein [Myxococcales bacterium]